MASASQKLFPHHWKDWNEVQAKNTHGANSKKKKEIWHEESATALIK